MSFGGASTVTAAQAGKKHLDHVQMNDFAGLGNCLCGDAIGFAPGHITYALEFATPAE